MNNYTIDTNRTATTHATSKAQQATSASQAFADFLNPSGKQKNSTAVNPTLTQDTSLLGKILAKSSWPVEREISFSNAKTAIEDTPDAYEKADVDSPKDDLGNEETASADSHSDNKETTDDRDQQEDAPAQEAKNDEVRDNEEVVDEAQNDGGEVEAVVVEANAQQSQNQATTQAKQTAVNPATLANNNNLAAQQAAVQTEQKNNGAKAGIANVKVTQEEVISKPASTLSAQTSVAAMNSQEAKVAASVNASAQEKSKGQSTATAANTANGKGGTPTQVAQAVLTANPGQAGNNTNGQSNNGSNFAKVDIAAAASTKSTAPTTPTNFAETLRATTNTAKAAPTAPTQSTLRSLNVTAADQLSIHIRKAVGDNKDSISIKLHPSELGRVDVKIEMADGSMKAMITAERPETLDLLQRDSRLLEKALQDAGLKTDGQSLSFNLKQDGNEQGGSAQSETEMASETLDAEAGDTEADTIETASRSSHDGDLDISI